MRKYLLTQLYFDGLHRHYGSQKTVSVIIGYLRSSNLNKLNEYRYKMGIILVKDIL